MRKSHLFPASIGVAAFVFLLLTADPPATGPADSASDVFAAPTLIARVPAAWPATATPTPSPTPALRPVMPVPAYPIAARSAPADRYHALANGIDLPETPATAPSAVPAAPETIPTAAPAAPVAGDPGNEVEALGNGRFRDRFGVYRSMRALVTAYCPCYRCCGNFADGVTSTGTSAWRAGAAADPRRMPYGTRIFVPGYGLAVVDDTGGAMRQSHVRRNELHLDMRMTYHYEARQWGRQYLFIRAYE